MSTVAKKPGISVAEYERRKDFLETLKTLSKAELVEIVRILQKFEVVYSENTNGIFFNVGMLDQEVFDALLKFLEFTQSNKQVLAAREEIMSSLATEMGLHVTEAESAEKTE